MALRWIPTNFSDFLDEEFNIPTMPFLNRLSQGLNIYETNNDFVVQAAMPGIPEDNIDVAVNDNGVVTVSGNNQQQEQNQQQTKYYMTSLSSSYNYSFKLPQNVTNQEPSCELDNGVLTLKFHKEQPTPPRRIKVKAKGSKDENESKGKNIK